MYKKIGKSILLCLIICNCSVSTKFYQNSQPVLNVLNYFCGNTDGYGIFFDYRDMATVRFKVKATGNCQTPGVLVLQENILFEDGSTENHSIEIDMIDGNRMTLMGDDLEGNGTAAQDGNAANLKYTKIVKKGLSSITFDANDWMYMIDKNQVINKINLKKFYLFNVGEIIIIWRK